MTLEQLAEQRNLAQQELEIILLLRKAVNVTPLKEELNYGVPNTV